MSISNSEDLVADKPIHSKSKKMHYISQLVTNYIKVID